jgi:hypothetical protein
MISWLPRVRGGFKHMANLIFQHPTWRHSTNSTGLKHGRNHTLPLQSALTLPVQRVQMPFRLSVVTHQRSLVRVSAGTTSLRSPRSTRLISSSPLEFTATGPLVSVGFTLATRHKSLTPLQHSPKKVSQLPFLTMLPKVAVSHCPLMLTPTWSKLLAASQLHQTHLSLHQTLPTTDLSLSSLLIARKQRLYLSSATLSPVAGNSGLCSHPSMLSTLLELASSMSEPLVRDLTFLETSATTS